MRGTACKVISIVEALGVENIELHIHQVNLIARVILRARFTVITFMCHFFPC